MDRESVIIGGKGASLSSSAVYAIANSLCNVDIDSSVSDKLKELDSYSDEQLKLIRITLGDDAKPVPNILTLAETRACLVLILRKLIITDQTDIRFLIPDLIRKTLNQESFDFQTLDFSSALGFLDSFFKLNGTSLENTGIGCTPGELNVLVKSCYGAGISAILDTFSSSLSTIADAVASLSCEALKADSSVLIRTSLMDSGGCGLFKDVVSVSRDLKELLSGSNNVVKNKGCKLISEIPEVHGSFRESVKQLNLITSVELNSEGRVELIPKIFTSFAMAFVELGESSFYRAGLSADVAEVGEMFRSGCPGIDNSMLTTLVARKVNYLSFFRDINKLVGVVTNIFAWESVLAILSIEKMEKDYKVVLGKGTAVIKQLLKDRLKTATWDPALLNERNAELQTFTNKVKEMVENRNEVRRLPKIPKGTRDFSKEQMAIRERAFKIIEEVFKRHGAMALDTPAFELRETLMGKYGEDSKLVFDLADQGGELCSLRYDLTVPFARYLAMNGISSFKRYQIGKVYRRDNPTEGRYREFYQCDFDISGQYFPMGPDFEVVNVLTELLVELNIGDYEIKLNHRKLLDGMLEICGVRPEKFRTICSSVDKLDKLEFEKIKKEMVEEKGLTAEVADRIGALVKKRGPPLELLSELKQQGSQFLENKGSRLALEELETLFQALERSKCIDRVVFDLSLARGLDYYTGVIFEAVSKGTKGGSIGAGGRYDNLIGMFSGRQVPAVGVSLGIERVFNIMDKLNKERNQSVRATETQVLVSILGEDLGQAAELVSELWGAKIKAEYMVNKRFEKHIKGVIESRIPFMVIVGEQEKSSGVVRIKDMEANTVEVVSRNAVVNNLQRRLNLVPSPPFFTLVEKLRNIFYFFFGFFR
ncbi:hypothetical protein MKW92_010230 [Papaver armeniacum]|nr:hypothetical protein MKW92_010230 [Papaver armeniacum]